MKILTITCFIKVVELFGNRRINMGGNGKPWFFYKQIERECQIKRILLLLGRFLSEVKQVYYSFMHFCHLLVNLRIMIIELNGTIGRETIEKC